MFKNPYNWVGLPRALFVVVNPIRFLAAIVRGRTLPDVVARTPVGHTRIHLRNYESLKTFFSVFCRRDYFTRPDPPSAFLDVGANVGIASAYFLSRNARNRIICIEPDPANLPYLEKNLLPFAGRSELRVCAVGTSAGQIEFFRSEDGKYSSMIPSSRAKIPVQVECRVFADMLREARNDSLPVVVKLDVEGMELDLVRSVDWQDYPYVRRLISESTECSAVISRAHDRRLRTGYVEDMAFTDAAG